MTNKLSLDLSMTEIRQHHCSTIQTVTHGRYFFCPAPQTPAPLLLGFHGYAESAEKNIEQLRQIAGLENWCLMSLEGLHLFYMKSGDVVASWMTKQNRLKAIIDNLSYLNTTLNFLEQEHTSSTKRFYLGFSQGAAMAYRAATCSEHVCQGVVILGGDIPAELDSEALKRIPRVLVARGSKDTFYSERQMQQDIERLHAAGVEVTCCSFTGGHEWSTEFYSATSTFLNE